MAEHSKIEWTDATWNPITGCSVVSPGCTNCYAMRLAGTRLRHHPSREGLTQDSKAGPVWTGEVRFNEQWLDQPLRWKRPRMIFVCAHGDVFHENVPDEWIDRVFAVMALSARHTFQVLTKRPERMCEYLSRLARSVEPLETAARSMGWTFQWEGHALLPWPIANVWLGTSVEDQERAEQRIEMLGNTPAETLFLSCEPLLGPLNLFDWLGPYGPPGSLQAPAMVDWVIVGGESGPGARPMDPDWARSIRDQCQAAGVPFFMKQMAKKAPIPDDLLIREFPREAA